MRLLSAEFWARALDDAVRHGATSALAGLGGDALGVVALQDLREVALLALGGFLVSLLGALATRAPGAPGARVSGGGNAEGPKSRDMGPSDAA